MDCVQDPGVRTFCTGYDLEGNAYEWGRNDISRIYRSCHSHDYLQSKWSSTEISHNKRYKLKKAGARIRKKIQNLVKDIHCKFTKYLCENYKVLLLDVLEVRRQGQC